MDPNPGTFPILSYVMSRLPSFTSGTPPLSETDIERPPPPSEIVGQMPNLADPKLLASMTRAISDVSQARNVLKHIGERPTHEDVDNARAQLSDLDAHLSRQLQEIVGQPRPPEISPDQWRAHMAQREAQCRESAEKEKRVYKSLIQLDEMHEAYEKMLKDAETRLVKIYENADEDDDNNNDNVDVNERVQGILKEAHAKGLERIHLSGQRLKFLPEAFGHIPSLLLLDLSTNQLSTLPDSIAGLKILEELNVSANVLESLPDSIGFLQNLKFLNVSGNKLTALPDSICHCRSLVELDVSFNALSYLPTNIGYELQNLQKLSIQLNKIRSLPSSLCEIKSLRYLDAHFNELRGLPIAIGKLTNLEVLNLSSNFSDLKELPETFGDLTSLRELDLSNNQIHALPNTFGRLHSLTKLNLEQNPIEMPSTEIVNQGVEAIKTFMAQRWIDILAEEEKKTTHELQGQGENGWLTRSTSMLKNVSGYVTDYVGTAIRETLSPRLSPRSPRDAYLDQQL